MGQANGHLWSEWSGEAAILRKEVREDRTLVEEALELQRTADHYTREASRLQKLAAETLGEAGRKLKDAERLRVRSRALVQKHVEARRNPPAPVQDPDGWTAALWRLAKIAPKPKPKPPPPPSPPPSFPEPSCPSPIPASIAVWFAPPPPPVSATETFQVGSPISWGLEGGAPLPPYVESGVAMAVERNEKERNDPVEGGEEGGPNKPSEKRGLVRSLKAVADLQRSSPRGRVRGRGHHHRLRSQWPRKPRPTPVSGLDDPAPVQGTAALVQGTAGGHHHRLRSQWPRKPRPTPVSGLDDPAPVQGTAALVQGTAAVVQGEKGSPDAVVGGLNDELPDAASSPSNSNSGDSSSNAGSWGSEEPGEEPGVDPGEFFRVDTTRHFDMTTHFLSRDLPAARDYDNETTDEEAPPGTLRAILREAWKSVREIGRAFAKADLWTPFQTILSKSPLGRRNFADRVAHGLLKTSESEALLRILYRDWGAFSALGDSLVGAEEKAACAIASTSPLYGEVLPEGVTKLMSTDYLAAGAPLIAGEPATGNVLLDLGCGLGRLAMQSFWEVGALDEVVGVEFTGSRARVGAAALHRLYQALARDIARTGSQRGIRWIQTDTESTLELDIESPFPFPHSHRNEIRTAVSRQVSWPDWADWSWAHVRLALTAGLLTKPFKKADRATPARSRNFQQATENLRDNGGNDSGSGGSGWSPVMERETYGSFGSGGDQVNKGGSSGVSADGAFRGRVRRISLLHKSLFDLPDSLIRRADVVVLATEFTDAIQLGRVRALLSKIPYGSRLLSYRSFDSLYPRGSQRDCQWRILAPTERYLTSWAPVNGHLFHLAVKLRSPTVQAAPSAATSAAASWRDRNDPWRQYQEHESLYEQREHRREMERERELERIRERERLELLATPLWHHRHREDLIQREQRHHWQRFNSMNDDSDPLPVRPPTPTPPNAEYGWRESQWQRDDRYYSPPSARDHY